MELVLHAALVAPIPSARPLRASATASHLAVVLWTDLEEEPSWFVTVQRGDAVEQVVQVPAHPEWEAPLVQAMPDGAVLVANATTEWRPSGPQQTAEVVDAFGKVDARGTLGDGINHLLTTAAGDIWVGYTDEGIYGNRGWEWPDPAPIGVDGLVRFNARLEPTWTYSSPKNKFVISECYSLNVTGDVVYASIYDGDAIVQIVNGHARWWPIEFDGATGLLIDDDTCALVGGYESSRERVSVGSLGDKRFRTRATSTLPGFARATGDNPLQPSQLACRGRTLHVFDGLDWLRATLSADG